MYITHIKFMNARTLVEWETDGNNVDEETFEEHRIKSTYTPHPDFIACVHKLVPSLRKLGQFETGDFTITEIVFNSNEESDSVTCKARKNLADGKHIHMAFPALEIKDGLVLTVQDIVDEAELFATGKKKFQPELNFDEEPKVQEGVAA